MQAISFHWNYYGKVLIIWLCFQIVHDRKLETDVLLMFFLSRNVMTTAFSSVAVAKHPALCSMLVLANTRHWEGQQYLTPRICNSYLCYILLAYLMALVKTLNVGRGRNLFHSLWAPTAGNFGGGWGGLEEWVLVAGSGHAVGHLHSIWGNTESVIREETATTSN